mgnify:CR=1 FL=1
MLQTMAVGLVEQQQQQRVYACLLPGCGSGALSSVSALTRLFQFGHIQSSEQFQFQSSEQSQFKALLFQHVTSTRAGCPPAAHHWRCWWADVTIPAAAAGALWSQCQRCQGSLHQDVLCTSRDCPIFYRCVIFVAAWLHLDTTASAETSTTCWIAAPCTCFTTFAKSEPCPEHCVRSVHPSTVHSLFCSLGIKSFTLWHLCDTPPTGYKMCSLCLLPLQAQEGGQGAQ